MSSRRKWAAWNGSTRSHTDKYKITNKQKQIKDHTHTQTNKQIKDHTHTQIQFQDHAQIKKRSHTDKYKLGMNARHIQGNM